MNSMEIYEHLKEIRAIDTHEHLWDESYRIKNPGDWSTLFMHYGSTSLAVAGMSASEVEEFGNRQTAHERKWELFSQYFGRCRNTSYIKAVLAAISGIYGIDAIDSDSMKELSRKIRQSVKPGFNRHVLREKANIDYCMVNCFDTDPETGERLPARFDGDTDTGLLRPDLFADVLLGVRSPKYVSRETGEDCGTLKSWMRAIEKYFETYAARCCSVKIGLAYAGALDFDPEAASKLAKATKLYDENLLHPINDYRRIRPLTDFLFAHLLRLAAAYRLPLKFHTGIYSGPDSVNMDAQASNTRHLSRIAIANPGCRFIAMHINYPYQDELVMAVKQIRNLYADMSWAWIVDAEAAKGFMKKVLCAAPMNKVTGFGGDYGCAENTYGHAEMARRAMASALSEMTESGYFSADEALEAGRFLLRNSAEILYAK